MASGLTALDTISPTLPSLSAKAKASIDKTAQGFEEMFATQLLQPMFAGIGVNPMFGGGHGEEVMRSFLIQEYGKRFAQSGVLGIANKVKAEMLHAQESASTKTPDALAGNAATAATNAYDRASAQGAAYVANQ